MSRTLLCLLAAIAVAGCESQNDSARTANGAATGPELAAYAGAHQYPTTMPVTDRSPIAAVVNHGSGTIKIYNFDTRPLNDAKIWVNQSFVQHINGIAPRSSVIIRTADLYNGLGQSFASLNAPVSLVQVEANDKLLTALGPAAE
jgi:hypothetical protein